MSRDGRTDERTDEPIAIVPSTNVEGQQYDHLQVMETITGKFHQYPLRNVGGVAETRTVDQWPKRTKGHNSGKKQSSVTSV